MDEIIDDIISEASSIADSRNGFIKMTVTESFTGNPGSFLDPHLGENYEAFDYSQ